MLSMKKSRLASSREIETDDLSIEYHIEDDSFAHAFGTQTQYRYEIDSVHVCVCGEWVNDELLFTDDKDPEQVKQRKRLNDMIEKCIDEDIQSNGYFDEPEFDKDRYYEEKYDNK